MRSIVVEVDRGPNVGRSCTEARGHFGGIQPFLRVGGQRKIQNLAMRSIRYIRVYICSTEDRDLVYKINSRRPFRLQSLSQILSQFTPSYPVTLESGFWCARSANSTADLALSCGEIWDREQIVRGPHGDRILRRLKPASTRAAPRNV